jgi:hypothetical protein
VGRDIPDLGSSFTHLNGLYSAVGLPARAPGRDAAPVRRKADHSLVNGEQIVHLSTTWCLPALTGLLRWSTVERAPSLLSGQLWVCRGRVLA